MRKKILTILFILIFFLATLPAQKAEAAFTASNNVLNNLGNETSQTTTAWGGANLTTTTAGKLVVLTIAINNISTADGQTNDITSVTDSQLNTWTKAGEYTNTVGNASADGATIAIYYSVLTTTLTTILDTITTNYSAAVTAKAVNAQSFTIGAGTTVSVAGSVQVEGVDNGDAASLTISGLSSLEYLFVRAIGSETDTVGVSTYTSSYAAIGSGRSGTGGSEKGHVSQDGEYRILTGTGDSSNPIMTDTTADRASVYVALKEVSTSPPFKTGNGLAEASIKTFMGLANASVKTKNGLAVP